MNIKKIYNYFFYLNTGAIVSGKETTIISSFEAFVIVVNCAILKKILFSDLKVSLFFTFSSFLIIGMLLNYFNQKVFKRRNNDFAKQWKSESSINKFVFKIGNVMFITIVFSLSLFILSCLD